MRLGLESDTRDARLDVQQSMGSAYTLTHHKSNGGNASSRTGYSTFAVFTLLLLSPVIAGLLLLPGEETDRFQALGYSILLWAWWVALCGNGYRACVLASPFLLFVPLDLYLLTAYHARLTPTIFGIISESDLTEATQFLSGLWLPAAAGYLFVFTAASVSLWLLRRRNLVWRHRSRVWVLFMVPLIVGGLYLIYEQQEAVAKDLKPFPNPFRVAPMPAAIENLRDTFPVGLILQFVDYVDGSRKLALMRDSLAHFRFGAAQTGSYEGRQAFILVIGESARADRWSINGYARLTSPRLARERNLINLTNAVSVAPMTRLAVPVILTRKPGKEASQPAFPERSLVSAFSEAGFSTYWMSTQSPLGLHDSPFSIYAKESEHVAYFNLTGSWNETPQDTVMLPHLKEVLSGPEPRQLIVIHTLGSHYDYRYRYTEQFDLFKPSPTRNEPLSLHDQASKEKLNNAYDNSILYTDYFLDEVITAVRASRRPLAALMYVSDHGEDLFDQGCENSGHGRSTRATYRIPFFFWYSDEYAKRFPAKVSALSQHRTEPVTTEAVFPTLVDAADIHFAGEDLTRSVSSPAFQPHRRIVTGFWGNLDYDHAHLNDQCELVN